MALSDPGHSIRKGASLVRRWRSVRSDTVLPIILGQTLQGPIILASSQQSINVPFKDSKQLHEYYEKAKSIVVVVNSSMMDNAKNLATTLRMNGLFIIQTSVETPDVDANISELLDKVNINAVTALTGPQSLVLVW